MFLKNLATLINDGITGSGDIEGVKTSKPLASR